MALVSVSGACSRSGKTALAETLLAAFPRRAAAVKFTVTSDVFDRCPRGTACTVCDVEAPFRIVRDAATLGQPGTDTARLGRAASRVVWAIARQSAVAPAWTAVRAHLARDTDIVMEGSTIVPLARPDLLVFVAHPFLSPDRWKPTTPPLVERADAVVVNLPASERRPPHPDVMDALAGARGRLVVADVTRPLASWAPHLAARLCA